jgi:hypothetical protein
VSGQRLVPFGQPVEPFVNRHSFLISPGTVNTAISRSCPSLGSNSAGSDS